MSPAWGQTTTTWNGSAWVAGSGLSVDSIPNANNHVIIASGTFTTSINSNFHCKNLTIESGATLVIVADDTFSVSGVVTNNGTITNNGQLMLRSCGTYSVLDIDGNSYNTLQIGTQCWTQSNLKVSKYRNGNSISNITDQTAWSQTNTSNTGAWCNYNNDAANATLYGKLYNWYAVNDSRGLCPTGWHVPSDAEWTTLTDFLGGASAAGGKMKNTGTTLSSGGWNSPNTGATNSTGFTGLPGGFRGSGGPFVDLGLYGYWWSSSDAGSGLARFQFLFRGSAFATRNSNNHRSGYSVRCIRDFASTSLPTVTTTAASSVTSTGANTGGQVTASGGGTVTARGVVYGTSSSPTLSGSFTYNGNESGSFTSTLSGLNPSTTHYVRAYATNTIGTAYGNEVNFTTSAPAYPAGTVHCSGSGASVVEVINPNTGKTWMDRNLGASRVATSRTDADAYGDLYQWGRRSDGHQCRNSSTTSTLSSIDQPAHGLFITTTSTDWRSPLNDNLWQGVSGTNNPCPEGFRLPTISELDAERLSWTGPDSVGAVGAYASPLKWTQAGHRRRDNASLTDVGSIGFYWSSTIGGSNAQNLYFDNQPVYDYVYDPVRDEYDPIFVRNGNSSTPANFRATAFSVRCIKN
ncbi:MAG: FISUMP domain-containing protein [Bacteroidota bacterium]